MILLIILSTVSILFGAVVSSAVMLTARAGRRVG